MSENPYRAAGVDYEVLDGGKRLALAQALRTSGALRSHGGSAVDRSRGEPAFVFELGDQTLALVLEGLGTKSMIAAALQRDTGRNAFDAVAYDAVAAIVNDLCCVGALPVVVNAYFATGDSAWYQDAGRYASLLSGWRRACEDAECVWGGGESPSLPGLVGEDEIEMAGSAIGLVGPGWDPVLGAELSVGDEIVLVASNGLHANGASLARRIAGQLELGYRTLLPSGRSFGDALLDPTHIYVPLVRDLLRGGVPVTYLSHITGHGLLKIMRPARDLSYRLTRLPDVPEVLDFIAERSGMTTRGAYSTLNMGVGFAVYCRPGFGEAVVDHATACGLGAQVAGRVEAGPRRVVLEPRSVTFETGDMRLSPDTQTLDS